MARLLVGALLLLCVVTDSWAQVSGTGPNVIPVPGSTVVDLSGIDTEAELETLWGTNIRTDDDASTLGNDYGPGITRNIVDADASNTGVCIGGTDAGADGTPDTGACIYDDPTNGFRIAPIVVGTIVGRWCVTLEALTSADDNIPFGGDLSFPVNVVGVSCRYAGAAPTTAATFTLEDGDGNAMTITGTNPTCADMATNPNTPAAVTAGNTLTAYEAVRFDVTNTPDPATDTYTICAFYSLP